MFLSIFLNLSFTSCLFWQIPAYLGTLFIGLKFNNKKFKRTKSDLNNFIGSKAVEIIDYFFVFANEYDSLNSQDKKLLLQNIFDNSKVVDHDLLSKENSSSLYLILDYDRRDVLVNYYISKSLNLPEKTLS